MAQPFWVYMLRCSDGSFYVGHTDELDRRMTQHDDGRYCRWTRSRRPLQLVWSQEFATRDEAKTAEKKLKGWSRAKKQALVDGDLDRLSLLASRGAKSRALRDEVVPTSPQGRGPR